MNFILEDSNYTINKISFNVDHQLAPHIKAPFPNQSFFMLIVGRAGSGKTNLLINLINNKNKNRIYRKVFNKILLVMPINSRRSLKNNPLDDLPEDQSFEEFDNSVIEKVKSVREEFEELDKKRKRPRNQLLIMDDITATLKNKDIQKALIELAVNRRHYKLSIILLVQYLRTVPLPVRCQTTDLIFFKPSNQIDTEIIEEEYINLKKDDFKDLSRFTWTNPHDFLYVSKWDDSYYKNLNKIKII